MKIWKLFLIGMYVIPVMSRAETVAPTKAKSNIGPQLIGGVYKAGLLGFCNEYVSDLGNDLYLTVGAPCPGGNTRHLNCHVRVRGGKECVSDNKGLTIIINDSRSFVLFINEGFEYSELTPIVYTLRTDAFYNPNTRSCLVTY